MSTTLAPKDPSEEIFYGTDFAALLADAETISSAGATIRTTTGTDATPSAMLSGTPIISGTTVMHKIVGGVAGCTYLLAFSIVTSLGQTFIESANLEAINRD